ncbi:MAG: DUF1189 family protein [Sphingobacteriia bacterium]|nr:DUF1189 family protein [Sphingobacteriia bacterium]
MLYILRSLYAIAKRTFFSKQLYLDVIYKWKGYGQKYLFVISLLSSLPSLFIAISLLDDTYDILGNIIQLSENRAINDNSPEFRQAEILHDLITKLPEIKIEKGQISANEDQPINIKSDINNTDFIRIDTSRNPSIQSQTPLVINRDKIIFFNNVLLDQRNLEKQDMIINYKEIMDLIKKFHNFSVSSFVTFCLTAILIHILIIYSKLFLTVVLATLTLLVMKIRLNFSQIIRVCSVALTPAIVYLFIFNSVIFLSYFLAKQNLLIPDVLGIENQLFIILAIGYTVFALIIIKNQESSKPTIL